MNKSTRLIGSLCLGAGLMLGTSAMSANAGEINTGYFGDVAIKGYDPVGYFVDGKAERGSDAYSYEWLGATWLFASDAHRRLFVAGPMSYAPQYGGLCAEGVPNGEVTVNIEPESWQIVDGKLYLSAAANFQERPFNFAKAEERWPSVHDQLTHLTH
jgi:YHS domain-containing protein